MQHGDKLSEDHRRKLDNALRGHGLTGAELTLKLDIFASALLNFLDEVSRRDAAEEHWRTLAARFEGPEPRGGVFWRACKSRWRAAVEGTRRVLQGGLRRVLGAADIVFDSFKDAVSFLPGPGAAAAAIKEFKDATDVVLGEPDEAQRPPRSGAPFENLRRLATRLKSGESVSAADSPETTAGVVENVEPDAHAKAALTSARVQLDGVSVALRLGKGYERQARRLVEAALAILGPPRQPLSDEKKEELAQKAYERLEALADALEADSPDLSKLADELRSIISLLD